VLGFLSPPPQLASFDYDSKRMEDDFVPLEYDGFLNQIVESPSSTLLHGWM
jgi:hypothetical protein